jgi:hypothetical protein
MATNKIRIKLQWWVMPYLRLCQFMVFLGIEADTEHISENVMKGIRVNGKSQK